MSDKKFLAALYSFTSFGPMRTKLLLDYFRGPKNAWNVSGKELSEIGLKEKTVSDFIRYRDQFDFDKYFGKLAKLNIGFTVKGDSDYPVNLQGLDDAPWVLYRRGEMSLNDINSVAIVGTRKMTSYGKEVTEIFTGDLVRLGVVVISGLARGIDTAAHRAAVDSGGRTIAVMGSGLDVVYPPENVGLARRIVESGGVGLSEYPLGYPAMRANFASRNRIISGLSKAVLVVEGMVKSGTLLTASHAATQGRTVFAVPGQVTSVMSGAPHYLLQNGAKFAFSAQDILEELDLQLKVDRDQIEKVMPGDETEEAILEILANEPLHLDEVVRLVGKGTANVSSKVLMMELKGMVRGLGGGVYKKV
jgi:DNA processing protein